MTDAILENGLTVSELEELKSYEAVIDAGLKTYFEVGSALQQIRENRLYRAQYATYEGYCQDRWGISRSRAYQLTSAAEVAQNLSTIVDTLPANEAQARPLAGLQPDQQREAWAQAVNAAPNGKPTATQVSTAAAKFNPPAPKFKIGDRVRYQGVIYQVSGFTSGGIYNLRTIAGRPLNSIPGADLELYTPASNTPSAASTPPASTAPTPHAPTSTPTPPAASNPPLSLGNLIKLNFIQAGIVPFKIVTHTNDYSHTYSAGFNSNGTREQADGEAKTYAALIETLGYKILNAGADIAPSYQSLGVGGENTPMVHFADAGYIAPKKAVEEDEPETLSIVSRPLPEVIDDLATYLMNHGWFTSGFKDGVMTSKHLSGAEMIVTLKVKELA